MNTPSASIRAWAQLLLAAESTNESASGANGSEVMRVCERLRISLTPFVGADGFTALLRRALALARADVPSLQTAKVTAHGQLEQVEEVPGDAGNDAAIMITAHLLGLLVTFIGEPITLRLTRQALPEAAVQIIIESEDFNEQRTN